VYCGARNGELPGAVEAATALGTGIARRGWQLVYGGGAGGLMGTVANAALAAGGRVIGYIPIALMQLEHGHPGLTELHVVDDMHQRKMAMAQRSDAFVTLPGGIGTFEEMFETWTWHQLGYHAKPVGLLNVSNYYDSLLKFLSQAAKLGYLTQRQLEILQVEDDVDSLLDTLFESRNLSSARSTGFQLI
jgi:uncharacterized protein (TIGR00730 family)